MTDKPEPIYRVQRMDGTWSKAYKLSEPYSDAADIQAMIVTERLTREEIEAKYPDALKEKQFEMTWEELKSKFPEIYEKLK